MIHPSGPTHTPHRHEETKHSRYHPLAQAVNHSLITPLLPPPFFSYQSSKRPHGLLNSEPSWLPPASFPLHAHGLYEQQQQAASGPDNARQPHVCLAISQSTLSVLLSVDARCLYQHLSIHSFQWSHLKLEALIIYFFHKTDQKRWPSSAKTWEPNHMLVYIEVALKQNSEGLIHCRHNQERYYSTNHIKQGYCNNKGALKGIDKL